MARHPIGPERAPSFSSEARKGAIAYNAWPREKGASRNEQRSNHQGDRREQFYRDVQRGSRCVLELVADLVADDGGFVPRVSFAAVLPGLVDLLLFVPCAASRVPGGV